MIRTFDAFCLWTYVLVDEVWPRIAPQCLHLGPALRCSDLELITMALVGECQGWDEETVLDSLPVPVIRFHPVPAGDRSTWQAYDSRFGRVPSKKATIFGSNLYLLTTLNGVILDFVLAPTNVPELTVGMELLDAHTELEVLCDRAFINAPVAAELRDTNRIRLLTLPRRNARVPVSPAVRRTLNGACQVTQTVTSQLAEQFHIEVNQAQSFGGLCARLYTKLRAHTRSLCLHRVLGPPTRYASTRRRFLNRTSTLAYSAIARPNFLSIHGQLRLADRSNPPTVRRSLFASQLRYCTGTH